MAEYFLAEYFCHGLWLRMTGRGLMLSRCGVTDVFCKQHGKTKELTPGYLIGLEQICTSDLGSWRESTDILVILSEETAVLKSKYFQGAVEGKHGKGCPSTSWTDDMKNLSGDGVHGASRLAADRDCWRTLLNYRSSVKSVIWLRHVRGGGFFVED